MKKKSEKPGMKQKRFLPFKWYVVAAVFLVFPATISTHTLADNLPGLEVMGVDAGGINTPLTDYRWLVEKDLNYHVIEDGGVPQSDEETLAVGRTDREHQDLSCRKPP